MKMQLKIVIVLKFAVFPGMCPADPGAFRIDEASHYGVIESAWILNDYIPSFLIHIYLGISVREDPEHIVPIAHIFRLIYLNREIHAAFCRDTFFALVLHRSVGFLFLFFIDVFSPHSVSPFIDLVRSPG